MTYCKDEVCMLQRLDENIKLLIAKYEAQLERAENAESELEKCRRSLQVASERNKKLEEKIDSLSLRNVFTSSATESSQAKARIDGLIQEVDRILAMLQ